MNYNVTPHQTLLSCWPVKWEWYSEVCKWWTHLNVAEVWTDIWTNFFTLDMLTDTTFPFKDKSHLIECWLVNWVLTKCYLVAQCTRCRNKEKSMKISCVQTFLISLDQNVPLNKCIELNWVFLMNWIELLPRIFMGELNWIIVFVKKNWIELNWRLVNCAHHCTGLC